jgi:hypothetical protein
MLPSIFVFKGIFSEKYVETIATVNFFLAFADFVLELQQ